MAARRERTPESDEPGADTTGPDEVLRELEARLEAHPEDVAALRQASLAHLELGQIEAARELMKRALTIEPDNKPLKKARKKVTEASLWHMVGNGLASWSGGKPKGSATPVPVSGPGFVSDLVHKNRR